MNPVETNSRAGVLPAAPALPVNVSERIVPLDVLRGVALLGILPMNIQAFSMIGAAYNNPTAYGDLHGANWWVWLFSHILADEKFMSVFSMLFGAGILLMTQRVEARGLPPVHLHYRRMAWLILFGVLHGYLLWDGDILYDYGMCGLLVYLFRKWPPRRLIWAGSLFVLVPFMISLAAVRSMPLWPQQQRLEMKQDLWQPSPELEAKELAAFRGGWSAEIRERASSTFSAETVFFGFWIFWRATGLMLLGMAMFKLGVFSAKCSKALYTILFANALFVGIPLIVYGVHRQIASGWNFEYSFFVAAYYNYFASLLVSFGWVGLVMLACKSAGCLPHLGPLAAVGRMALSNYILHTMICTAIFYGHGFGLFGKLPRTGQIEIVAAIWVLQLVISPIWLRKFQFGPLEWLWRSLTYLQRQPFVRPV